MQVTNDWERSNQCNIARGGKAILPISTLSFALTLLRIPTDFHIVRNAHFFRHRPHFDARRRPPSRSMRTGDFPRPPPRRSARTETPRPRIGANGAHSLAWCMSPLGHVAVRTALLAAGRRGRQPVPASRRGHRHRGAVTPPPRAPSPPRRGCRRPSRRSRARGRSAASCSHFRHAERG